MKKALLLLTASLASILIITLLSSQFSYVGSGKCKICHKTEKQGKQYILWQETKHSTSFTALTTEKVIQAAQEKEMESMPAENPKCLRCHAPLFEKTAEIKEEGVTCEVCHGPGSTYKKLSIMKNREEAIQNGLTAYASPEEVKAFCLDCHENAHQKPFDFEAAWERIKHPRPEK